MKHAFAMIAAYGYSTHAAAVAGYSVSAWIEGTSDLEIWTRPF